MRFDVTIRPDDGGKFSLMVGDVMVMQFDEREMEAAETSMAWIACDVQALVGYMETRRREVAHAKLIRSAQNRVPSLDQIQPTPDVRPWPPPAATYKGPWHAGRPNEASVQTP